MTRMGRRGTRTRRERDEGSRFSFRCSASERAPRRSASSANGAPFLVPMLRIATLFLDQRRGRQNIVNNTSVPECRFWGDWWNEVSESIENARRISYPLIYVRLMLRLGRPLSALATLHYLALSCTPAEVFKHPYTSVNRRPAFLPRRRSSGFPVVTDKGLTAMAADRSPRTAAQTPHIVNKRRIW